MGLLLGIDVGTSACKAVVLGPDGAIVGSADAAYPVLQPAPTWAEQDPDAWWRGCAEAVRSALSASGTAGPQVSAVGLTGQMHGAVALDDRLRPVRPAVIWSDQRSAPQAEALRERAGAEVLALVANPPLPNFTATKLLWIREHEPEEYARIAVVLLPKDYVRLRLTGCASTDVTDASGTLAFDVSRRRWSAEMCSLLDIPLKWWPEAAESAVVTATVSDEGAAATGLRAGTPVVAGAGDQAASAVGAGIVAPGMVSVTIGTSGVVFAATSAMVSDPLGRLHTFCHAVPGGYHVMGVTQSAGGSLHWWRDAFCHAESAVAAATGEDPYEVICREAVAAGTGAGGLLFLPYLMGERTPHTDPLARGVFFGITPAHGAGHFAAAVLEGVSQSLADCLDLILALGCEAREIRITGGGARSALWRQIQADVFGRPVRLVRAAEGPASGAAMLAGVGSGAYASVQQAAEAVAAGAAHSPRPEQAAAYARQRVVWRQLYQALRPVFAASVDDAGGVGAQSGRATTAP